MDPLKAEVDCKEIYENYERIRSSAKDEEFQKLIYERIFDLRYTRDEIVEQISYIINALVSGFEENFQETGEIGKLLWRDLDLIIQYILSKLEVDKENNIEAVTKIVTLLLDSSDKQHFACYTIAGCVCDELVVNGFLEVINPSSNDCYYRKKVGIT